MPNENKIQEFKQREYKKISSNKKALYDYSVISKYEAGIMLAGTEVKSLRSGKCNLQDSYCYYPSKEKDELVVDGIHISPFEQGNRYNHEAKRPRKLLLNKRELVRLRNAVNEKGLTIVPLEIYFSGHLVKLEIALVKPKKKYDKRETEKTKSSQKEINRALSGRY